MPKDKFLVSDTIDLTVFAKDFDGHIDSVKYFINDNLFAVRTLAPFDTFY
ncbi:MAG: hypothetical protein HC896_16010, partial [Bacteroidales bacterium]|nr:hypothetical protein [Bacteroidales bacterium]